MITVARITISISKSAVRLLAGL